MARQHGYYALVPVFIPVPKNDLPNQIAAATALHEAGKAGSLDAIMALPGVRLHVKPGKEIANRWTSVAAPEVQPGTEEERPENVDAFSDGYSPEFLAAREAALEEQRAEADLDAASDADPATTTGRRSRAKAA